MFKRKEITEKCFTLRVTGSVRDPYTDAVTRFSSAPENKFKKGLKIEVFRCKLTMVSDHDIDISIETLYLSKMIIRKVSYFQLRFSILKLAIEDCNECVNNNCRPCCKKDEAPISIKYQVTKSKRSF